MCGVVAAVSAGPSQLPALHRAMQALHHRGPDGRGHWQGEGVLLGHTRLGIVAPWDAQQPLVSRDGQTAAVVNGELYGWRAQRAALEAQGHRFTTSTDSEVALHLYRQRGDDFLQALRGEFALVIWDARQRRLLAARDRFGVRPLCWAWQGRTLWLASQARALLAAGVPASWDHQAVHQAFGLQYTLPEQTLFQGVQQLAPGQALSWQDGVVRTWRWAQPLGGPVLSREEAAPALLGALQESVALRLQADVPVACQLSGGLDSSAIAALATEHLGRAPTCFTVGFEGEGYDERPLARGTAARLGAELVEVSLSQRELLDALPEAVAAGEGLVINLHAAAKHQLVRRVREAGFKVLLSGEGADELLGGYAHLRLDKGLAARSTGPGSRAQLAGVHLPEGEGIDLSPVQRQLGFVPAFLQAKATLGLRAQSLLHPDFARRFTSRDPALELMQTLEPEPGGGWRRSAQLWSALSLAGYILRTLGDGLESAWAVEGRPPFLDGGLATVAARLPDGALWRDGLEKVALREAVGARIPAAVAQRPKHPFMAPPCADLPRDFVQDWLDHAPDFLSRPALGALMTRWPRLSPRQRVSWDPVLFMVVSASILSRRYRL